MLGEFEDVEPARLLDSSKSAQAWGAVTYSGPRQIEPISRPLPRPKGPRDRPPRGHLTYAPGLDGVRAIAVTAVVIYHLGAPWLPGGFLGVDVFFVLSGFLITSILLTEFRGSGRIDIKNFYLRRARRLLPALYTMLAGITLVTAVTTRDELHRLRGDVLAALTYCTNWTQTVWNRSYFDQLSRPSLMQHLWSLAVEEQFYLVWPLLLVVYLSSRRRWMTFAVTAGLIAASTLWMAVLYTPGTDPYRVYYGTDTHIAPMLVGAALAIVLVQRRQAGRADASAASRLWVDGGALLGLAVLVWAATSISYRSAGLYRGGYLVISIATLGVVLAAASPATITARVLGWAPFVWVGRRSYAIYLWHWPILMLTRPRIDVPLHGPVLITLQVAVILVLSDLSFRYLERPIRKHGFLAFFRGTTRHASRSRQRRRGRLSAVTAMVVAAVVVTLVTAPGAPAGIQVDHHKKVTIHVAVPTTPVTPTRPVQSAPNQPHTTPPPPPFARPVRVSFFGDSQGMTLLINKPNGLDGSITTSDSTVEGCGVLLGTIASKVGFSRNLDSDCGNWPTLWAQHAQQHKPQIAVVELGAWDVFDDTVDGTKLAFGSSAWDAYYEKQLAQGIKVLIDAGAQVALMGVPCYRPIAAGGLPLLPERGYDDRTRHVTALLRAAAAKDPQRVFMINPPGQFCHDPISTDVNYRWDGTHFYIPGAALMFQVITPQLLAIPQPPKS
jgi:peptidoglycan/LPS O-acetylase OafA/YrhL